MQDIPIEIIRTYSSTTLSWSIAWTEVTIKGEYKEMHNYIKSPQIMPHVSKNLDRLYRDRKNLHEERLRRLVLP